MSTDPTEAQGGPQRLKSQEMSLERGHPPIPVPGYEPEKFLGMGAYGEVWVARERNTGRRVAIKFYAHRGGLDWSLLSREVEKLAFLFADRYVVQLLGVGWDAEPPYYIMEYLERGSLAERLLKGPLSAHAAVEMFRDVAIGLVHAHGKGVLHCDLKPANILLDQDNKPRLADFGQSRLSHEQMPALGTLFYMAPEQADLEASPDARWDVYALGALLYCMLTGSPPHRTGKTAEQFEKTPHLVQRLSRYRKLIDESPPATGHRQVRHVDRALADIVDRCLAPDPEERFPNVQAVLDALDDRAARRARRPMMILGAVGPALLLLVVSLFAFRGLEEALRQSDTALTARALESNKFAAKFAARAAVNQLEERYRAVQQVAASTELQRALADFVAEEEIAGLLDQLGESAAEDSSSALKIFREHERRQDMQDSLDLAIPGNMHEPKVTGWFLTDTRGVQVARIPQRPNPQESELFASIGKCYAWRSYFHGDPDDLPKTDRPTHHIDRTTVSAVFRSQATNQWMVAISHPVYGPAPDGLASEGPFLGVVALMVDLGRFVELEKPGNGETEQGAAEQNGFADRGSQFAVLLDWRKERSHRGVILQHPVLRKLLEDHGRLPEDLQGEAYRVLPEDLPAYALPQDFPKEALPKDFDTRAATREPYRDPLDFAEKHGGPPCDWLVQCELVAVNGDTPGWAVIIQEDHNNVIGSTLETLQRSLIRYMVMALAAIALVVACLWSFVIRTAKEPR
ncbi:MAG: serine/threonine protein kinase [Thermoguttaceae bacterium]